MLFRSICLGNFLAFFLALVPFGEINAAPSSQADYILQPYDLIKVEVFQEPDLAREVRLSQESTITLPLIGTIDLKGKAVREVQDQIRRLYDRDYLVNPQINVSVTEYSRVTVNVLGSVSAPGAILIPPDQPLKLLDAITHAGGFTRLADRKRIKLTRIAEDGRTATFIINADDIIQSTSEDKWVLKKGDVIYVPERIL